MRSAPWLHADSPMERGVQPILEPLRAPEAQIVIDGLPWRQIMGQQPPGTGTPQRIKNRMEDVSDRRAPGSPYVFRHRQ